MDIFDAIFNAYADQEIEGLQVLNDDCYVSIPDDPDLEEKVGNAERHGFFSGLQAGLMLFGKKNG